MSVPLSSVSNTQRILWSDIWLEAKHTRDKVIYISHIFCVHGSHLSSKSNLWIGISASDINQAQIQRKQKSGARGQQLLVCVLKAHVLGKYCIALKCRSKQKQQREGAQCAESELFQLSVLALPDVLEYTHWCFWGTKWYGRKRQCYFSFHIGRQYQLHQKRHTVCIQ